ncbi:MAG: hypothetical protein AAF226_01685 [Verrucomicrobiota bacterium]
MNWKRLNFDQDTLLLWILRIGAFGCFIGWAWVHYYWEGPYGVLLWKQSTYALAESLGISWDAYVGTGANDGVVQKIGKWLWVPFAVCAILSLTVRRKAWVQTGFLGIGFLFLVGLSYAKYLKSQEQLPMFVEHGGQMLMPVILVLAVQLGVRHKATVIVAIIAFIATFAGHGCYALGLGWPTPNNFYAMTGSILKTDHQTSTIFLRVAGVLDFIICVTVFFKLLRRPSVLWGVIWGGLTALARPVAGMSTDLRFFGADLFLHETVLRAPHWMIPLFLFVLWTGEGRVNSIKSGS